MALASHNVLWIRMTYVANKPRGGYLYSTKKFGAVKDMVLLVFQNKTYLSIRKI